VLNLLDRIRRERGLTVLMIGHDLAVVRRACDQTVVMRRGEIASPSSAWSMRIAFIVLS